MTPRIVFDANIVISRMLLPRSAPAQAVSLALGAGTVLTSTPALEELAAVLSRKKFDRYVTVKDRQEFFKLYCRVAESVEIVRRIEVCRDPSDDKYLEIAANGQADFVVTGDEDLLVLDSFESIPIVTPTALLDRIRRD
jgi:putative PIN family toxin of toxin-antitoxin system